MPAGQFFPKLTVNKEGIVEAGGPLDHTTDKVVEMCVWVYQRSANGSDAIANAMDDGPGLKKKMTNKMDSGETKKPSALKISRKTAKRPPTWKLDLDDRMHNKGTFTPGSATALAIGVFLDAEGHELEKRLRLLAVRHVTRLFEDRPLRTRNALVDLPDDQRRRLVVPARHEQRRHVDLVQTVGDVPALQRADDMELARSVHGLVHG